MSMYSKLIFVAVEFADVIGVVIKKNIVEEMVFAVGIEQDCVMEGGGALFCVRKFVSKQFRCGSFARRRWRP